jgi:hypothetical protein
MRHTTVAWASAAQPAPAPTAMPLKAGIGMRAAARLLAGSSGAVVVSLPPVGPGSTLQPPPL